MSKKDYDATLTGWMFVNHKIPRVETLGYIQHHPFRIPLMLTRADNVGMGLVPILARRVTNHSEHGADIELWWSDDRGGSSLQDNRTFAGGYAIRPYRVDDNIDVFAGAGKQRPYSGVESRDVEGK